jgi:hypothetical protein
MSKTLLVLLLVGLPAQSQAQQSLAEVAKTAREAVLREDLGSLVSTNRGVQLRLPGVDPSAAMGRAQARATIRELFRKSETTDVFIEDFREVGGGRAFVELTREYKIQGSPGRYTQRILMSYRQSPEGWQLVEVRAN